MTKISKEMADKIKHFVLKDINIENTRIEAKEDKFWKALQKCGTELWLDTGDMEEASKVWTTEMTALTTNNTLLNNEIQKGIYDNLIKKAGKILADLTLKQRIIEIAFILNARHALYLVEHFGGKVSVELHTDLAHNVDSSVEYGRRFYEICPEHFIIKVPYTPAGLIAARKLREYEIPVNFTLEFSARQNAVVAALSKPNYQNVFLGRLNAYIADNKLGDGELVGEKATIEAQKVINRLTAGNAEPTKLIAASLRNPAQLDALAGIDVFTIPLKVAKVAKDELNDGFHSKLEENYQPNFFYDTHLSSVRKLWEVQDHEMEFINSLDEDVPEKPAEIVDRAVRMNCIDMFPALTEDEQKHISNDGKIPKHSRWRKRIEKNEVAIDSLLNLAGLATFANDQKALDKRIEDLIA